MTEGMPHKPIDEKEAIWVSWCNLGDLRLVNGDIGKAIVAFREKMNKEAGTIGLNPKNEELAGEAVDGIQVGYHPCILLWEVWISANPTVNFVPP